MVVPGWPDEFTPIHKGKRHLLRHVSIHPDDGRILADNIVDVNTGEIVEVNNRTQP